MKVVWFKRAVWDLRLIQSYITQDNPQAAQETVNQIKDKVSLLIEQPGIGRLGRIPNTKELISITRRISCRTGSVITKLKSYGYCTPQENGQTNCDQKQPSSRRRPDPESTV